MKSIGLDALMNCHFFATSQRSSPRLRWLVIRTRGCLIMDGKPMSHGVAIIKVSNVDNALLNWLALVIKLAQSSECCIQTRLLV